MQRVLLSIMVLALILAAGSVSPADDAADKDLRNREIPLTAKYPPASPQPAVTTAKPAQAAPWWETTAMDKDRDHVFDILESQKADISNIYVDYDHAPMASDLALLSRFSISSVVKYVDAVGLLNVSRAQFGYLTALPGVVMLEGWGTPMLYSDIAVPNAKIRESEEYSPEAAWELGVTGKGASIAVIDTGVDDSHPSLVGKWLGGADISKPEVPLLNPWDGSKNADDTQGHGTTCTGIAMGTGAPDGVYKGSAPDARLVDVRIGTIIGYAPGELFQHQYDASVKGIEWAIDHHDDEWPGGGDYKGIDIISLSWGVDVGGSSDGSDIYSRILDRAVESGIIVSNAAGNSGPDNTGFDGFASASLSIKIAASDDIDTIDRTDDIIASYSSRGPRQDNGDSDPYNELSPDVAAPGTGITQVQFDRTGDASSNGYGPRGSGTSYATPCVAGLIALMLEANPALTNAQVREILHYTAERMDNATFPELDPFWNKDWGYGLIDGYAAVKLAREIDQPTFEPDLQCFIMSVTNISGGVKVEGLTWAKTLAVEKVEVKVDGVVVKTIPIAGEGLINWSIELDTTGMSEGNHTIGARAVSQGMTSIEDKKDVSIMPAKSGGKFPLIPVVVILLILAALGVAAALFYIKRRSKG